MAGVKQQNIKISLSSSTSVSDKAIKKRYKKGFRFVCGFLFMDMARMGFFGLCSQTQNRFFHFPFPRFHLLSV
jgi:hypothetical protein